MTAQAYREYRKDGWPICPHCRHDALRSRIMAEWRSATVRRPTLAECLDGLMRCGRCGWTNIVRPMLPLVPRPLRERETPHYG